MNCEHFSSKSIRVLAGLVLLMVLIALGSYASLNFERINYLNPAPPTISVVGEGEVLAVPDVGVFSFSVRAEADTASVAQEQSGTKINDIRTYLREQKIEDKDIKVTSYNLYPRYRYEERVCATRGVYCPPGEQVQDGFEVTQTISVKVRQTDAIGAIIAGVGERGATDISGLEFMIDDIEVLKDEARAKAIVEAREKVVVLADRLGVKVDGLVAYYEENFGIMPMYAKGGMMMDMATDEEAAPVAPEMPVGEQEIKVVVNITYRVK